jgi:hypothetical protein
VTLQLASQSATNVAWKDAVHSLCFAFDAHSASQSAAALALQLAEQSNCAGVAWHFASQSSAQLPVQSTDGTLGQDAEYWNCTFAAQAA